MPPTIPVNIVGLLLETLLYGIFILLFVTSTYFFLRKRPGAAGARRARLYSTPTLYLSALMCILVTTHWVFNIDMTFQAFASLDSESTLRDYYNDTTQFPSIAKYTTLMTLLVIGDISIIYRLWLMRTNHSKCMMIFPVTLFAGFVVSAVGFIHAYLGFHWQPGQPLTLFAKVLGSWITGLCVFSACTSLYCNALISWIVWRVERAGKSIGARRLAAFRAVTVESAVLYTCWGCFYFMAWKIDSAVSVIASDTLAPVTGITFMLINVRLGLQRFMVSQQVDSVSDWVGVRLEVEV